MLHSPKIVRGAALIYLSFALMLCFYHAQTIDRQFWVERSEFHQGVIRGDFKSPYQYRVLSPWLSEIPSLIVIKTLNIEPGRSQAMVREGFYLLQRFLATFLLFVIFHLFLRTWFAPAIALSGTLILVALHVFTYRSYFYQPDSPLNLLFLTTAAYLMSRGEFKGWLYPLAIVGSLTRETFGLIVPMHLAFFRAKNGTAKHTLGLLATWMAVQILLRLIFGLRPSFPERPMIINFYEVAWPLFLFSLMWIIPFLYFKRLPLPFRWLLVMYCLPLITMNMVFGKVEETRLFLDLAIAIIPSVLFALFPEDADERVNNSNTLKQRV